MSDRTIEHKLRRLATLREEVKRLEDEIAAAGAMSGAAARKTDERPAKDVPTVGESFVDEDLASLIVTHTHDLITIHAADGTYLWISDNCNDFLGVPRERLVGTNAYELFHPEDLDQIAKDHADTLEIASSRVTYRLRQGDGSYRWAETRSFLNHAADGSARLVAITRDVHDRVVEQERARDVERRLNQRLLDLASTDALTKLMNRMSGDTTLRREISRVERSGSALSIVVADIDHFKSINDRYGHPAGDEVLLRIAEVMRRTVREHDHVCRWGGEEFLIILPDAALSEAAGLAERVRVAVRSDHYATDETVTLSAGVAAYQLGERVEAFITRADVALYRAKESGRDRVIRSDNPGK